MSNQHTATAAQTSHTPVAGRPPTAAPAAAPAGALLALALLGVGVIALRDTAVALQWLRGTPWIDTLLLRIDGMQFASWMIPAGIAAVAVGITMMVSALRPRPQNRARGKRPLLGVDLTMGAGRDHTHAANSVPGVFDARSAATLRALTVSARVADAKTAETKTREIDAAVRAATQILRKPLKSHRPNQKRPTDMTRLTTAADRVAALIVGVTLVALGAGALLWRTELVPGIPHLITAPALVTALDTWWWRWAVAGAGLLCVAVALRWLLAHRPARKAAPILLHEEGDPGTVIVDPAAVAAAAAEALNQHPGVYSAKGKAITDQGLRTIELAVTTAHPEELPTLIRAIDDTCANIAECTGDSPLAARATLHIKGGRELPGPGRADPALLSAPYTAPQSETPKQHRNGVTQTPLNTGSKQ